MDAQQNPNAVDLRDYIDTMFAEKEKALQAALLAQEKAVAAALESSDKAITKAETNAEKWRASANEWRGAMSDRDRELPSRREVDTAITGIDTRLAAVEHRQDRATGKDAGAEKSDIKSMQVTIAVAGFVIAIASIIGSRL